MAGLSMPASLQTWGLSVQRMLPAATHQTSQRVLMARMPCPAMHESLKLQSALVRMRPPSKQTVVCFPQVVGLGWPRSLDVEGTKMWS